MARSGITVVIPAHPARVRNGMLGAAVNSAWEQTLIPDAVVVAVDNERQGAPATRARALAAVDTEWTAFLDSDDMFLPRHLEWCKAHADKTGADYVYAWFKVLQQFADGRTNVLEEDPVFPVTHYLNPFDPADPIETTITVLVKTELAQSVGMRALDRGEVNTGEDRAFLLDCLAAGAKIEHVVRKSWLWRHHQIPTGKGKVGPGNTSGMPSRGDSAV